MENEDQIVNIGEPEAQPRRRANAVIKADDRRTRHAAAQRRHRQRAKEEGVPTRADIGLAAVESWRREMQFLRSIKRGDQIVNIGEIHAGQLKRLVRGTISVLLEQGFNRSHAEYRLKRFVVEGEAKASKDDDDGVAEDDPDERYRES